MCRLALFALTVLATVVVHVHGSTSCNFHQLRQFSNNSLCNKRIHRLVLNFHSTNWSINEIEAQLYCTEECAGNFVNFLRNQWDCQKEFKKLYVKILTSLCSRNEEGKQCIHMLRPSPDDSWNNSNSSSLCSQEHHSHLQGLVDKYGCCFKLSFEARIKSEPELFCDIHSPPLCMPDYELSGDVIPGIAGLAPKDQASDTNSHSDSFSSNLRTSLWHFMLVLVVILSLSAVA